MAEQGGWLGAGGRTVGVGGELPNPRDPAVLGLAVLALRPLIASVDMTSTVKHDLAPLIAGPVRAVQS